MQFHLKTHKRFRSHRKAGAISKRCHKHQSLRVESVGFSVLLIIQSEPFAFSSQLLWTLLQTHKLGCRKILLARIALHPNRSCQIILNAPHNSTCLLLNQTEVLLQLLHPSQPLVPIYLRSRSISSYFWATRVSARLPSLQDLCTIASIRIIRCD